ncbi:hypothetical protein DBR42_14585 [Pelomonas sp. HMWF004]|nr:hypothetical protein DBR42_14585 [Pelomonas sp. HMWF004]
MNIAFLFCLQAEYGRHRNHTQHVRVVGGGTVDWMMALMLATSAYGARLNVTVLESPQVGARGVGEGSTPWLHRLPRSPLVAGLKAGRFRQG